MQAELTVLCWFEASFMAGSSLSEAFREGREDGHQNLLGAIILS